MKKTLLKLFFAALPLMGYGQVIITQIPPNPVRFNSADIWDITITNAAEAKSVYLKGVLNEEFGLSIFEARTTGFELEKGTTKISPNEIGVDFIDYNTQNPSAQIIHQFNNLPYGKYTLCVYLYDALTNELLAESCIDHESQPITPPILITPDYCQELNTRIPFFSWLAPTPEIRGQHVYYDFKLVEVYEKQSNEDAIQRNMALLFVQDLTTTSFLYPSTAMPLDSNKKYAWQILAKIKKINSSENPTQTNHFRNVGISEVWCLLYKMPNLPPIIVEKENITYIIPKLYEEAEINVTNILYLSFQEDFESGKLNYLIFDKKGQQVDVQIPLAVKRGDNRYDINLKQTGLFTHNAIYKLKIIGNNKNTYYINFRYIEK